MTTFTYAQRRFLLWRRRQIKPKRQMFSVRIEGDLSISYRCAECGKELMARAIHYKQAAQMMLNWHSEEKGGCLGNCPRCTKQARDRLYPLPKEEKR